MRRPTRLGLIGSSGFAAYHLWVINKLENEGLVKLVAIADPADASNIRSRFESQGGAWYGDFRDMLAETPDLDAVSIVAPIGYHEAMARACIERGCFVYLEKPPVPTIRQLEDLIALDKRKRVSVGFQMIASRGVQRIKKAVVEEELGKIESIRAWGCWPRSHAYYRRAPWAGQMSLGGEPVFDGPATNGLAHLVHNIMYLASPCPHEFDAPQEVEGELFRARQIESYDVACLRGRFQSGILFSATLTHATEHYLPFHLKVTGSKGWMQIIENGDGTKLETSSGEKFACGDPLKALLHLSYLATIDYIRGGRPRALTHLSDTRGYVMATNGMLVSSGGIRDIEDCWVRRFSSEGGEGVEVIGLPEAVDESGNTGKLFSEMRLPWAVNAPEAISLDTTLGKRIGERFRSTGVEAFSSPGCNQTPEGAIMRND